MLAELWKPAPGGGVEELAGTELVPVPVTEPEGVLVMVFVPVAEPASVLVEEPVAEPVRLLEMLTVPSTQVSATMASATLGQKLCAHVSVAERYAASPQAHVSPSVETMGQDEASSATIEQ